MAMFGIWRGAALAVAVAMLIAHPANAVDIPCPDIDIGSKLDDLSLATYWDDADRKTFSDLRTGDKLKELAQVHGLFIASFPSQLDFYFRPIGAESHAFFAVASHDGEVRGVQCSILIAP
jgi:hypothetical protein